MSEGRTTSRFPAGWNLKDLLQHLGVPAERVRLDPPLGTATEEDALRINAEEDRLYELVDGVLVEKVMGYPESTLAVWLAGQIQHYLDQNDLGNVAGANGIVRLMPGMLRIPDVSFVSWERVPEEGELSKPVPEVGPDLVVEVLSEGNTPDEMARKVKEYCFAGARLVWLIDPAARTAHACSAPDQKKTLTAEQPLDGGDVLPGFQLPLKDLFARLDRLGTARRPPRKRRKSCMSMLQ
jgi:Uma2 family endonuclease